MKKLVFITLLVTTMNLYAPELTPSDKESKELIKSNERELEYLMQAKFSEDNLRRLLILLEVEHVDMVMKQSKLESGHYRSRVFREGNNFMGMHLPRVRDTYASGYMIADRGRKVATYDTWQDGVLDYIAYIQYFTDIGYCIKDYTQFLIDANYCEKGSYYIELLNKIS